MKRRIAVLLCVLLCTFGLTACSSSGASDMQSEDAASYKAEAIEIVNTLVNSEMTFETLQAQVEDSDDEEAVLNGWDAWVDAQDELGAFAGLDESSATVKYENQNKLYIVSLSASFEKRDATLSITFDKEGKLSSVAFNPNYSFGEKMAKAAMNTVMGLVVVFVMLVAISLIIYCFNFIHAAEEKARAAKETEAPAPAPAPAQLEEEDLTDDLELVAVIAAAIAASEGTSPDGLVVRSIKRAGKSNWKRA